MKLKNKMKDEAKNKEMKKNKKSNIKQKNLKSRSEAKVSNILNFLWVNTYKTYKPTIMGCKIIL